MATVNTMTLKYLFVAYFDDGSIFEQTQDDISLTNPEKSRSYDVLNCGKKVVKFSLTDGQHNWSIDLLDGHFEVDGMVFHATNTPLPSRFLQLVFFRSHQVTQDVTYNKEGEEVSRKDTGHKVTYFTGWQATVNGKNYQHVVGVE